MESVTTINTHTYIQNANKNGNAFNLIDYRNVQYIHSTLPYAKSPRRGSNKTLPGICAYIDTKNAHQNQKISISKLNENRLKMEEETRK